MRIESGGNSLQPHVQTTASKSGSQKSLTSPVTLDSSTAVDLTSQEDLLQQLVAPTDVREALVNDLRLKIQLGEYLSQRDAVDTATAILNL